MVVIYCYLERQNCKVFKFHDVRNASLLLKFFPLLSSAIQSPYLNSLNLTL